MYIYIKIYTCKLCGGACRGAAAARSERTAAAGGGGQRSAPPLRRNEVLTPMAGFVPGCGRDREG